MLSDRVQEHPEEIARAVLRSRNAAAIASVLQLIQAHEKMELRTLRALEQRTTRLDEAACELQDECDEEMRRSLIGCAPRWPSSKSRGAS